MANADHFTNPYDAAYYAKQLGPFQTDGFVEWGSKPGLTLADLTFPQLLLIMAALLALFLLSTVSVFAGLFVCLPTVAGTLALSGLRRRFGHRYISTLMWLRELPPPDGFYPFQPVPTGELRKVSLHYEMHR